MKICLSSTGDTIDASLDPRFGRCNTFLIYDTEDESITALSNSSNQASGGAGIKAAEHVARQGVELVITGNIGPNAYRTLSAAHITVITGAAGTIHEVIENYKKGNYKETQAPNVSSHHGMG